MDRSFDDDQPVAGSNHDKSVHSFWQSNNCLVRDWVSLLHKFVLWFFVKLWFLWCIRFRSRGPMIASYTSRGLHLLLPFSMSWLGGRIIFMQCRVFVLQIVQFVLDYNRGRKRNCGGLCNNDTVGDSYRPKTAESTRWILMLKWCPYHLLSERLKNRGIDRFPPKTWFPTTISVENDLLQQFNSHQFDSILIESGRESLIFTSCSSSTACSIGPLEWVSKVPRFFQFYSPI